MTQQRWITLLAATMVGSAIAPSLRAQETNSTDQLLTELGQRCNRATEVSYRSQRLTDTDTSTEAYVEGLIRNWSMPTAPYARGDTEEFCYPDRRETVHRDPGNRKPGMKRAALNWTTPRTIFSITRALFRPRVVTW
jgi:hypothetical protein